MSLLIMTLTFSSLKLISFSGGKYFDFKKAYHFQTTATSLEHNIHIYSISILFIIYEQPNYDFPTQIDYNIYYFGHWSK